MLRSLGCHVYRLERMKNKFDKRTFIPGNEIETWVSIQVESQLLIIVTRRVDG